MTTCLAWAWVAIAATLAVLPVASAQGSSENQDLGLIPSELQDPMPPASPPVQAAISAPARVHKRLFAEDAFSLGSPARTVPVPYPVAISEWQNRTSFDLYLQWMPWRPVTVTLSNRLNVLEQEHVSILSRHTVRNDLREAYVTCEVLPNMFFEAGRINLRNGAALGWNPTDFFKTRTLVGQASLDRSAMRQNRLGTLMARFQKIWDGGSVSIAYAPKIYAPPALEGTDRMGIDPRFDATNAAHRVLASVSLELGEMSPQLFGYYERERSKIGMSLSRPFGDAVIAYAEWVGGEESNLITRGFAYGLTTGTLPPQVSLALPTDTKRVFRNDVAAGGSFTIASKITLNAEYHFHQAGFSHADWRNWFDMGSSPQGPPGVAGALWYVRGYANEQQEPTSRHQVFVRAAWPRAFTSKLELSGFALVDLYRGSTLAQMSMNFYLSDAWTFALYGSMNAGPQRSERGSLPQFGSVALQVSRYL